MDRSIISDLRDVPQFVDVVSERIWREWWFQQGSTQAEIRARVAESLDARLIPFTLVAHREGVFVGTVSVIENDLAARPQYGPWVAAVFVEPERRGQGFGTALVTAATETGFLIGADRLYLCAAPTKSAFYERLGWCMTEADVDGLDILEKSA
ncbi:GNAT family N-acetyltransferase [Antarcticirhabdus aurantiaca]|uniref:GNAT family N-acetyltransferase n=1 Tax=Antarcticirhabdus aurantiaca TaxID=2606717 RepID=A0ACD4NLL7_9HYPH|nr:GNAT family N-acetyltransferase [Antarcticirhabdus aurantiaca]WAJ27711.1 GNAT family N-acetyltransferase [Jeongeuplla avenae]